MDINKDLQPVRGPLGFPIPRVLERQRLQLELNTLQLRMGNTGDLSVREDAQAKMQAIKKRLEELERGLT